MIHRRYLATVLVAIFGLASAACAAAGNSNPPGFTDAEKKIIEEYVLEHPGARPQSGNPAGHKAKGKKPLPPGIAKNLQRGKPLPPGIAKNYLPDDLSARLPKRPGYERVIIDGRVILVEIATGIVRDILEDVLFPDD